MLSVASLTVIRHYDTLATGIIYFHRFYMFHSFKQFPRYVSSLDAYPSVFLHSQTKCVECVGVICVSAGDGCLLSFPGRESGGNPKEV